MAANYASSMRKLVHWLREKRNTTLLDAEPADLPDYLTWRAQQGIGASRRVSDWQAITLFYKWLAEVDPDSCPKRNDKPVVLRSFDRPADKQEPVTYTATSEDVRRLLAACGRHRDKVTGRRNAAMIALLWCGLRRGELCVLDVEHVDLTNDIVTIPATKNGDVRRVPIDQDAHERLFKVLRDLRFRPGPLFVGRKGRLTPSGVEQALQWPREKAGLQYVGLHAFRRGWATDLLGEHGGMERKDVMILGGWKDERSMAPYDKSDKQRRAITAYRAARGGGGLRAVK